MLIKMPRVKKKKQPLSPLLLFFFFATAPHGASRFYLCHSFHYGKACGSMVLRDFIYAVRSTMAKPAAAWHFFLNRCKQRNQTR
jgi:hypothetical protein